MKIKGIEGMSIHDLQDEVDRGGKFVIYTYCVSIVVMSFKRSSSIYFIKKDQNAFVKSLPWTATSLVFGWWGIPWGIIYTIGTVASNIGGGKNVTDEVMTLVHKQTGGSFDFERAEMPQA